MLRTRLITAAVLIPIAVGLVYLGALPYLVLVGGLLSVAEVEFGQLMQRGAFRPNVALGLGLLWVWLLDAQFPAWGLLQPGIAAFVLAAMAWHMWHRQGSPVADWALTVTGGLYLGLCGACLVRLRALEPDGMWWTFTVLPTIMLADTSAYLLGRRWGRHKMAPALSPGKTWEGYAAGILTGAVFGALLPAFYRIWAPSGSALSSVHGLILGLVIATVAPLGDFGVSMMKRFVGVKDSGTIIPGHGGALDRVDSILWAGVIGLYYVLWAVA